MNPDSFGSAGADERVVFIDIHTNGFPKIMFRSPPTKMEPDFKTYDRTKSESVKQ